MYSSCMDSHHSVSLLRTRNFPPTSHFSVFREVQTWEWEFRISTHNSILYPGALQHLRQCFLSLLDFVHFAAEQEVSLLLMKLALKLRGRMTIAAIISRPAQKAKPTERAKLRRGACANKDSSCIFHLDPFGVFVAGAPCSIHEPSPCSTRDRVRSCAALHGIYNKARTRHA